MIAQAAKAISIADRPVNHQHLVLDGTPNNRQRAGRRIVDVSNRPRSEASAVPWNLILIEIVDQDAHTLPNQRLVQQQLSPGRPCNRNPVLVLIKPLPLMTDAARNAPRNQWLRNGQRLVL